MESNNEVRVDYKQVWNKIWERKKLYVKTLSIVFVLSCLWIFPQPRNYETKVSLAPEMGNTLGGDAITSLASTFGLNIGGLQNKGDAIYPTLYPEIVGSSSFIISLFDVTVTTGDGKLTTTYYDYLLNHRKMNPYLLPVKTAINWGSSLFTTEDSNPSAEVNPFQLTKKEYGIVRLIAKSIQCKVDKKTDVITILVTDHDAFISACIADTVRQRLQDYVTDYRTKKARHDMEYYDQLTREAWAEYNQLESDYSSHQDSHINNVKQSVRSNAKKLERSAEIKYNTYSVLSTHLQAAQARVQERTPAFTIIQPATVPIKPVSPKRLRFVFICLFLTFVGTSIYILRDIVK